MRRVGKHEAEREERQRAPAVRSALPERASDHLILNAGDRNRCRYADSTNIGSVIFGEIAADMAWSFLIVKIGILEPHYVDGPISLMIVSQARLIGAVSVTIVLDEA